MKCLKGTLEEIPAGTVIKYDSGTREAEVELSYETGVGNWIRIKRVKEKSDWDQRIKRMSKDGKPVNKAFSGDIVRIGFLHRAEENDRVFLLICVDPPVDPPPPIIPDPDMPDLPDPGNYPDIPDCKGKYKRHGSGG